MMIDAFTHIVPPKYLKALNKKAPSNIFIKKVMESAPTLTDMDSRFRIMDKFEGLLQVLSIGAPALEAFFEPKDAVELAKIANDEMAELVAKHSDRFATAIAALPLNDMDATLEEIERTITELRFRGILISSDLNGKPLDSPDVSPIYEKMVHYNLPILIHPKRPSQQPDYPNETESKYSVFLLFGWPYDSTLAMTRISLGGVFDRYPNLKIMTHHCGAMVPFFGERIAAVYDTQEMRWGYKFDPPLARQPADYFRMFYADTAVSGSTAALMCGYDFFGSEHLLFGSDMPYDNQIGERYTRDTIASIERMDISDSDKKKIFEGNAKALFRLPL